MLIRIAVVLLFAFGAHAQALDDRALENLIAFTRVTGYVRYFHPAAATERMNWDAFTASAIAEVEQARTPEELDRVLKRLYPMQPAPPRNGFVERSVRWEHRGVNTGPLAPQRGLSSKRITTWHLGRAGRIACVALSALALVAAIALRRPLLLIGVLLAIPTTLDREPPETFTADLGRGLTWTMPLELPKSVADAHPPFVASGTVTPRAQRLASVIAAWNVLQHFYPYFDQVQVDWPAALRRALRKAATDADGRAFLATLRRMGHDLRDSHAWVRQFRAEKNGRVPFRFGWIEEQLVVTAVANGVTDVRRGDVVQAIDGIPARAFVAERTTITPGATDAGAWHLAVYLLPRGPSGETMRLTFGDGVTRTYVFGTAQFPPPRYAPIADVAPGIVRVDIGAIDTVALRNALPRLEKARGIIFALDIYPGGFPEPEMLKHLMDEPFVTGRHQVGLVRRPDRQDLRWIPQHVSKYEPREPRLRAKVVFTTSPIAVSYAEHVLDSVQYYRLGKVVGGTTAGSFGEVNQIQLPGRIIFEWTGARSNRLDGTPLHGRGIRPDVPVARTIRGVREGRDEVLEAAIAVLQREIS